MILAIAAQCALATALDLPPDPGKAGEQTLEGVDSNHNGVRDDVERYIALHYANSGKTRAALVQYAQAMQTQMISSKDKVKSMEPTHKVMQAYDCLVYVVGNSSATKMMNEMQGLMLNSLPRLKAYLGASPDGTDFYRLPLASERKRLCSFDPDLLPN